MLKPRQANLFIGLPLSHQLAYDVYKWMTIGLARKSAHCTLIPGYVLAKVLGLTVSENFLSPGVLVEFDPKIVTQQDILDLWTKDQR